MALIPNVIEEHTVRFLNVLVPGLSGVPPSYYVGALAGIINTCLFYLAGFGRGFKLFVPFLAVGTAGAIVGLTVGRQLPETGPQLGEVSVLATTVSTWTILFVARSLRL